MSEPLDLTDLDGMRGIEEMQRVKDLQARLDAAEAVVEAARLVRNATWFEVRSEGEAKMLIDALFAFDGLARSGEQRPQGGEWEKGWR